MTNKEIISRILTTLPTSYYPFKKSWYSVSLSYRTLDNLTDQSHPFKTKQADKVLTLEERG
jgi:hypothetical protein